MTASYAKERIQFDRPIGSFQAIQHKRANMVTDVDGARYITYQAAWKPSEGLPATMEVSIGEGLGQRGLPADLRRGARDPRRHWLHQGS